MKSYVISTILISRFLSTSSRANEKNIVTISKCVRIYYDRAPDKADPAYYAGRLNTVALENLVSHFPDIQQYIIPIHLYQKGQLEHWDSSIYFGSRYNNPISKSFKEGKVLPLKSQEILY